MRKLLFILAVLTLLIPSMPVWAITAPASATTVNPSPSLLTKLSTWKEKDLRKQLGRKLTVKEKVAFFMLKKKTRKMAKEEGKTGENAYVAGLLAIGLFVAGILFPPLLIGSFIAAIVAVASGSKALKIEPGNKKAKTGRLLGWITLFLFLLSLIGAILLIALISGIW